MRLHVANIATLSVDSLQLAIKFIIIIFLNILAVNTSESGRLTAELPSFKILVRASDLSIKHFVNDSSRIQK